MLQNDLIALVDGDFLQPPDNDINRPHCIIWALRPACQLLLFVIVRYNIKEAIFFITYVARIVFGITIESPEYTYASKEFVVETHLWIEIVVLRREGL